MSAPEKLSRAEVADLVDRYRKASKSLRGLKTDHFGNPNVDTMNRHTRVMTEAWARLTRHGHEGLAKLLSQWHSTLKQAQYELTNEAKHSRNYARGLTDRINREVQAIQ